MNVKHKDYKNRSLLFRMDRVGARTPVVNVLKEDECPFTFIDIRLLERSLEIQEQIFGGIT